MSDETVELVLTHLADAGIEIIGEVDERTFPGEHWFIVHVPEGSLTAAQSLAGSIENKLNNASDIDATVFVVNFRGKAPELLSEETEKGTGRLAGRDVDQFIQLLEARSRTSDALPSLKYMEDPRATLASVGTSRHQIVYGRRGVGKTALLLEAKRQAEGSGYLAVWLNAHVLRKLSAEDAFSVLAEAILETLSLHGGSSTGERFERLAEARKELTLNRQASTLTEQFIGNKMPDLNSALKGVLREDLIRLYVYIDDFYLVSLDKQPFILDYLAGILRDCNGWLKVASIERLTRPFEPSSRHGLEIPHDATTVDLDVTLEDPRAAQSFLESVVANYTTAAGIRAPSAIAKRKALGRLVLASGGVPRDYLNLFATSVVVARQARQLAREVGKEDVAVAAGRAAQGKKRDLELDVTSGNAGILLDALDQLSTQVRAAGYTFFRVNLADKGHENYELLGQLMDLRFIHLVQASLSDQHKQGVRYEAYMLDLSEFTQFRLKRGLQVLDIEHGSWALWSSGTSTVQTLGATQLRDALRLSPVITLEDLTPAQGAST